MRLPLLIVTALLCGPMAAAQQPIRFSPDATLACIEKAQRASARLDCIGESARACFKAIKNASNVDIAACMAAETGYWTGRMNAAYKAMMAKAEKADEEFAKSPMSGKVPFKLTDDLEIMQSAWSEWREKRCAFEAMLRRGTPYAMTAAANCTMERTGEQALFLESAVRY